MKVYLRGYEWLYPCWLPPGGALLLEELPTAESGWGRGGGEEPCGMTWKRQGWTKLCPPPWREPTSEPQITPHQLLGGQVG